MDMTEWIIFALAAVGSIGLCGALAAAARGPLMALSIMGGLTTVTLIIAFSHLVDGVRKHRAEHTITTWQRTVICETLGYDGGRGAYQPPHTAIICTKTGLNGEAVERPVELRLSNSDGEGPYGPDGEHIIAARPEGRHEWSLWLFHGNELRGRGREVASDDPQGTFTFDGRRFSLQPDQQQEPPKAPEVLDMAITG